MAPSVCDIDPDKTVFNGNGVSSDRDMCGCCKCRPSFQAESCIMPWAGDLAVVFDPPFGKGCIFMSAQIIDREESAFRMEKGNLWIVIDLQRLSFGEIPDCAGSNSRHGRSRNSSEMRLNASACSN